MTARPGVFRMTAAPNVFRMKVAPNVLRMTAAPALLVLLLLCVCEVGVGGAQESPPSLTDVMREVKVLRGMVVDLRGDNAVMAAKLRSSQKQLDVLQSSEDQCCCNQTLIQSLQSRLGDSEDQVENLTKEIQGWMKEKDMLVKDLDQLRSKYNDLESRWASHTETTPTETTPTETTPTATTPTETTPNPDDLKRRLCESDGFTFDSGLCYLISKRGDFRSWDKSRQYCVYYQSDLIIMNSQEKKDILDRIDRTVWIGLTDREKEKSFKWVDGTPLTSPTFWRPGQPGSTQYDWDCVFYDGDGPNRGWNDAPCDSKLPWMCERVVQ